MLDMLEKERPDFLFLGGVIVLTAYFVYATASLTRPDSAAVPWVILTIMIASLASILALKLFGDRIRSTLGLAEREKWLDIGDEAEDEEAMFDIDLVGVGKELVIISVYVLGMLYVGFFTSTVVFITAYILVKETSPLKRRLAYVAIWNVGVLGILYVLFVELLNVSAIFRLGFLP
ncbi:tripartite tricarboxylate transporter TctB family protein [Halorubrum sp. DTA46]|uniref:tripartite tricarboxylate transporter TctB family protein n=1 Tax=Halorubrum sp. DTA46 TaxID=3402162 RepID=UPI003AAE42F5